MASPVPYTKRWSKVRVKSTLNGVCTITVFVNFVENKETVSIAI